MKKILIAGTHSGCGKTTVTCAVIQALLTRGLRVSAYKCGPDYIDPMFHREILKTPSYNLDAFFYNSEQLRRAIRPDTDIAVIEGVMGYYDGIGAQGEASTYHVAYATEAPVVLVIDAHGMLTSAGAILRGFLSYRSESGVQAVIFNNVSESVYPALRTVAEHENVVPLGFLPKAPGCAIGSRHLGLITPAEMESVQQKLYELGVLAEKYLDLENLLAIADVGGDFAAPVSQPAPTLCRIAVSRDKAFCFLYSENIELLQSLGAEIVFFSPLQDERLPEDIQGLYLCGGYPELHLDALSANESMLCAIKSAVKSGLPTIAECGGFMYLHRTVDDYKMAGVIDAKAYKTSKLRRFGYTELIALRDNLLCDAGDSIRAHEFHFYESTDPGDDFLARKPFHEQTRPCAHVTKTLYAGFAHLFLPANPRFAENFVRKAACGRVR